MFIIRISILLSFTVHLITCLERTNETMDYLKLFQQAHSTNEASRKYSRQVNASPIERLKLMNVYEKVIARAEEIQASGFDDVDPYDVSSVCLNHTKLLIDGLIHRESWAWRSNLYYNCFHVT